MNSTASLAFFLASCLVSLAGCQSYQTATVEGSGFTHRTTEPSGQTTADVLHLYIEGDGRPFITPTRVATDPTPKRPYVLRLMSRDKGRKILLGRPCYHGLAATPPCQPKYWTTARYAPEVVSSMVQATNAISAGAPVVLIGYSGGGALAMLMAPKLPNVLGIITISANLDTSAWTQLHGYSPLAQSLNPAEHLAATADVPQVHYVGAEDPNVPPELFTDMRKLLPKGSLRIQANQDHKCCWPGVWPQLLAEALNEISKPR